MMNMKRTIALIVVSSIILAFYMINKYTNNWIVDSIVLIPKWIAFIFALIVIMFPRDYEKVPDILF